MKVEKVAAVGSRASVFSHNVNHHLQCFALSGK
jgi:hypothetical protein